MTKQLLALFLFLFMSCGIKSTETGGAADSLKMDSSVVGETHVMAPTQSSYTGIEGIADSLINHPLAIYHGEYKLRSSSSAEQARLTLQFVGNNAFKFFLDYQVADFCSATKSGNFTVDDGNGGTYDDSRPLIFTLADRNVQIADPKGEFGVGQCQFSGDFVHCDGHCEEISWEGFDDGPGEGDGQDPADSASQK